MNTMLFSQPVAGMLYEPDGDPDGVPVTIIGLEIPETRHVHPWWQRALVVDADGVLTECETKHLVFVGLAPLHTNTTEAIDLDPRNRP